MPEHSKNTLSSAEKAVLNKMPIKNKVVNGENVILKLFRENGIELPPQTQEWVKSSLVNIFCYPDGEWSYRYKLNGGISAVMDECLDKLIGAVEAKHKGLKAERSKDKPSILGELDGNKNEIASRQTANIIHRDKKEQTEL